MGKAGREQDEADDEQHQEHQQKIEDEPYPTDEAAEAPGSIFLFLTHGLLQRCQAGARIGTNRVRAKSTLLPFLPGKQGASQA
jgi:hypothetical protein